MELGGVTEVAIALGMSKQRVAALRGRPSFPRPEAQLAQGPVWDLEKVRRWASSSRQPRGRPHTLSIRRRLGNRYELEGLPDATQLFNRATDLAAVSAGCRCSAVALHFLPRPESEESATLLATRLELLRGAPHPHVLPVLDFGIDHDDQPFLVTPLPVGRLTRVLGCAPADPSAAIDILWQVTTGALHLTSLGGGVGFSVGTESIVQTSSSAWSIGDLRPEQNTIDTGTLVLQLRGLVRDLRCYARAGGDVLDKSFVWLESRLGRRSLSLSADKLIHLLRDDLEQVVELLSHGHGVRGPSDGVPWEIEAVRQGGADPGLVADLLRHVLPGGDHHGPNSGSRHAPAQVAKTLALLTAEQLAAVGRHEPELLRRAVACWARDLGEWLEVGLDSGAAVDFLARISDMDDPQLLQSSLLGLVSLANLSASWHARWVLISLLQHVHDPRRETLFAETLSLCDDEELRVALVGSDPNWFPPKIRDATWRATAEPVVLVDLTDPGLTHHAPDNMVLLRAAGVRP
ncbi:MAG: hypothetical protein KGQ66_05440 [Acidobacteriota bacterium]|nr:hypothetical protein [Acidobacteriota bacterium]